MIDLTALGDVAIVRIERFVDRNGNPNGEFQGIVTQDWHHDGNRWTLLSVDVSRKPEGID